MHIVKWKNKTTGQTGQGSPVNEATANEWAKLMNEQYPDIHHWVEPVEVSTGLTAASKTTNYNHARQKPRRWGQRQGDKMQNHILTSAQAKRIGRPDLAGQTVQVEFYKPGERGSRVDLQHVAKYVYSNGKRIPSAMNTKEQQ
jgi:hypothetical protein